MEKIFVIFILAVSLCGSVFSANYNYRFGSGRVQVNVNVHRDNSTSYSIVRDNKILQRVLLDNNYGENLRVSRTSKGLILNAMNNVHLRIELVEESSQFSILSVRRSGSRGTVIRDCIDLQSDVNSWYGGPQQKKQYWPVDRGTYRNYSYLSKEADNCGVAERYWLNSDGLFFYVEQETPLFIDQNVNGNYLCLIAQKELPYNTHTNPYTFNYFIGVGNNARHSHMQAIRRFLGKPIGHPAERMVKYPIWSTWARYKREIDETIVMKFADEILANGFTSGQFEIDDDWEICYGALEFRESKFPDIAGTVKKLKEKDFTVTLWIHPFINKVCEPYYTNAKDLGYLVADHNNNTDTQWWNSNQNEAAYIDFTKPEAVKWYIDRLKNLLQISDIDSYKFDAGETSWTPPDPVLNAPSNKHPLAIQTDYVNAVSQFGPLVEVRSAQSNQHVPIFMREIDKDSLWSFNNGLPTMITTALTLNMVGYPFVLPDMIGGNGYEGAPGKELFIRWLEANVFLPGLQYSYVPWDYDEETIRLSLHFTELHAKYSDVFMQRFALAVKTGEPVNPPLWWIAPNDRTAQMIDDQYLLGEDIIVAPVMKQGETTRHIYLPRGRWIDQNNNDLWIGPKWLMDYPAPLDVLPYFIRQN